MSARTPRGDRTRRQMLAAAADLFHKQGVLATSPDQIIEASGTGKGQFYHYFKSKEGLVHAVLQHYLEEIRAGRNPAFVEIREWPDLERWFLAHLQQLEAFEMNRGCPFGTIGNALRERDHLIRADLAAIFDLMKGNIQTFLAREQAAGRLAFDAEPGALAEFCIATVQGALILGRIRRHREPVEQAIAAAIAHLRSFIRSA